MEITIRLQSFSDIITNSSSEIFCIKSDYTVGALYSLLKANLKKMSNSKWIELDKLRQKDFKAYEKERINWDSESGMGGIIEIKSFDEKFENYKNYIPETKRDIYTKEMFSCLFVEPLEELEKMYWVNIDEGYKHLIRWFLNTFFDCLCDVDTAEYEIEYKDKKIYKLYTICEFNTLPEKEKLRILDTYDTEYLDKWKAEILDKEK